MIHWVCTAGLAVLALSTPIVAAETISQTAAAEPAAWILMITGFGVIGGLMRRSTKAVIKAA